MATLVLTIEVDADPETTSPYEMGEFLLKDLEAGGWNSQVFETPRLVTGKWL